MNNQISTDPAVTAARKMYEARAAVDAIPDDESTPKYKAATGREDVTMNEFAAVMPTTPAGAIEKLKYVTEDWEISSGGPADLKHIQQVMAYLKQLADDGHGAAVN